MRSLGILFLIAMSGLAPGLSARGEEPLTLDRALAVALERNPRILAAEQEVAASKGRTLRLKAYPDPSLSFSDEGLSFRRRGAGEKEYSFGVEQSFEFPGKRALRGRIGGLGEERAALELERTRLLVGADVKRAYFRAVLSRRTAGALEGSSALVDRLLENLAARQRAGAASSSDILRARVEKARLRNQTIEEAKEGAAAVSELNLLLGRNGDAPADLATDLAYVPLDADVAALRTAALASRPSLRIAAARRGEAETGLALARKSGLPDLSLGLYFPSLRAGGWGFSIGLSLPVLGQRRKGEVMEAAAAEELSRLVVAGEELRVAARIGTAFDAAKAAGEQVRVFEGSLLKDLEDDITLSLSRYRYGEIAFFELLDLFRTFASAKLEHLRALYLYNVSLADLEVAGEEYAE
jgi:cobalt-zinc-cadmium efflux system outer membrane protein